MLDDRASQRRIDRSTRRRSDHTERRHEKFRVAGSKYASKSSRSGDSFMRGLGFGERDNYGPDQDYSTVEIIENTLGPTDYTDY